MVSSFISNAISKWPKDFLPGFINGGILGRELIIDTAPFLNSKERDSNLAATAKTIANFFIRGSSLAFSKYNFTSLAFLWPSNALFAGYKAIRAINYYRKGYTNEYHRKLLEVAAHVALFGVDYFLIRSLMTQYQFDALGALYVTTGLAMDISKTSKQEILDRISLWLYAEDFPPNYDEDSAELSEDWDSDVSFDSDSDYIDPSEEAVGGALPAAAPVLPPGPAHPAASPALPPGPVHYAAGEVEDGFYGGDDYEDYSVEEIDDPSPRLRGSGSMSSPVGDRHLMEENEDNPRLEDECTERRTTGGMQLRDPDVIRPPLRFLSPPSKERENVPLSQEKIEDNGIERRCRSRSGRQINPPYSYSPW